MPSSSLALATAAIYGLGIRECGGGCRGWDRGGDENGAANFGAKIKRLTRDDSGGGGVVRARKERKGEGDDEVVA